MEKLNIKGEEVSKYTVAEFIRATRPDGKGHIYLDGDEIAEFEEVLCDCCNAEIIQSEDKPDELVVFCLPGVAWCKECFEGWEK